MARKVRFHEKERSNDLIFGKSKKREKRPYSNEGDYGFRQNYRGPERSDMDWIQKNSAYRMQIRERDQDPTNVYGMFDA